MHAKYSAHDTLWRRFLIYDYPGVNEIRKSVAKLSTSRERVLAIKDVSHDIINATCTAIILELLSGIHGRVDLEHETALEAIKQELFTEFGIRLRVSEGWASQIGMDISLKLSVARLEQQIGKFNQLPVTDESQKLWQELADWFSGKHLAFAWKNGVRQKFKKNRLGHYPFLDANDRIFWLFYGVRQLDLIMPYRRISRIIQQRIHMHENHQDDQALVLEPDTEEVFLPQPSKKKLSAHRHRMIQSPKPSAPPLEPQPSAPPLEPQPSAPPLEEKPATPATPHIIVPTVAASAPPLTDDDISESSESSENSTRPEFECPLTHSKMKSPAICTLDGISYEAQWLQKTLEMHGRTPTNIPVAREKIAMIMRLNTNLKNAIKRYRNDEPEEICYCCPITKHIMREAVFCTLDNLSYEKEALREYLTTHGKTPNGIPLPDGVKTDDVIVPNITLRKAIETYQQLEHDKPLTMTYRKSRSNMDAA